MANRYKKVPPMMSPPPMGYADGTESVGRWNPLRILPGYAYDGGVEEVIRKQYSPEALQQMLNDPQAEARFQGPVAGVDADPLTGEAFTDSYRPLIGEAEIPDFVPAPKTLQQQYEEVRALLNQTKDPRQIKTLSNKLRGLRQELTKAQQTAGEFVGTGSAEAASIEQQMLAEKERAGRAEAFRAGEQGHVPQIGGTDPDSMIHLLTQDELVEKINQGDGAAFKEHRRRLEAEKARAERAEAFRAGEQGHVPQIGGTDVPALEDSLNKALTKDREQKAGDTNQVSSWENYNDIFAEGNQLHPDLASALSPDAPQQSGAITSGIIGEDSVPSEEYVEAQIESGNATQKEVDAAIAGADTPHEREEIEKKVVETPIVIQDTEGKDVRLNSSGAPVDGEGKPLIETTPEQNTRIEGLLSEFFGLQGQDVKRALGMYLLSRATGASHAGSMRWAGKQVFAQSAQRQQKAAQNTRDIRSFLLNNSDRYDKEFSAEMMQLATKDPDAAWAQIAGKDRNLSASEIQALQKATTDAKNKATENFEDVITESLGTSQDDRGNTVKNTLKSADGKVFGPTAVAGQATSWLQSRGGIDAQFWSNPVLSSVVQNATHAASTDRNFNGDLTPYLENEFVVQSSGLSGEAGAGFVSLPAEQKAFVINQADTFASNNASKDERLTSITAMSSAGAMYSLLTPQQQASIPFEVFASSVFGSSLDKAKELNKWLKANASKEGNMTIDTINAKLK